jgi:hypothetical protein
MSQRIWSVDLNQYVEFPDGTSSAEMERLIREHLSKSREDDGVDIRGAIGHGFKAGAAELIETAPDYMAASRNVSPLGVLDRVAGSVAERFGVQKPDIFSGQKAAEDVLRGKAQALREKAAEQFEPDGLKEKVLSGLAAAPASVVSIAPALAMTALAAPAGPLAPAIGFGVHGAIRGGKGEITTDAAVPAALGVAEGAAFGYLPKVTGRLGLDRVASKAIGGLGLDKATADAVGKRLVHNLGISGIAGGATAAHGGDAEDVAASAATMFAVGGLAEGGKLTKAAKNKIKTGIEDIALQEAKNKVQFKAPGAADKFPGMREVATRVAEGWFNPDIRIERAVNSAKAKLPGELEITADPILLRAGYYPSTASSQARAAAKYGLQDPIDPSVAPRTKSLHQMSKDVIPEDRKEIGKYEFRSGLYEFEKDMQTFLYANRTKEILKKNPEYDGITDKPDAVISAIRSKYSPETIKKWEQAQGDFNNIGNFVVDFLKRAEVFDDATAKKIKDGDSWVNMGRFFDEVDGVQPGSGNQAVQALRGGGKQKLNDIWVNTTSFIERAYKQANFQYYFKSLVDLIGDGDPNMKRVKPIKFARGMPKKKTLKDGSEVKSGTSVAQSRPMFDDKTRTVTFRRDGKPESWQLSKEWYDAVKSGGSRPESWWIVDATLGKAKRMATLGRTGLNPGFSLITNTLRDFFTGALQSPEAGAFGQEHIGRVLKTTLGRRLERPIKPGETGPISKSRERYELSGARIAGPVEADIRNGLALRDQILASPESFKIPRAAIKHPIEAARNLLAWSEDVNRFPEYYLAEQKLGAGTAEANVLGRYMAQEVTLNFARMGKYARWANEYIPFFNASLQGARKFTNTIRENPKAATLRAMSTITAPAMALWALNKDEEFYQEIPAWEKALFMHFKVGDGPVWRVPMPFEWFTFFGALPVAVVDAIYREDPQVFKDGVANAFETLSPEIIPQGPKPIIETMMNRDLFRDRPIESKSMQRLIPEERYRESTPYVYRGIGSAIGASPVKIQHIAESYTGGLAREPALAIDTLLGKDADDGKSLPLVNRLISSQDRQGQSVADFYRERETMDQAWSTARSKHESGDVLGARRILEQNADALGLSRGEIALLMRKRKWKIPDKMSRFNKIASKMSEVRKRKGENKEITTLARLALGRN